ncbi:MAG: helix-turn-helix domain-containing protein [Anaerolineae bacterium]|nr:helix-turn-helix domain-containing protein [Anaerolineae bacterium]
MRTLYVRDLTEDEQQAIRAGLRSSAAFTVRRCQILLMSSDEQLKPKEIGQRLHCSDQCVRDAIRTFEQEGLACLREQSRARHTKQATFDEVGRTWLKEIIRQSPRSFGFESSLWTLAMLAELAYREGYSERVVNPETVSRALAREKVSWKRAKKRINSPDEQYVRKKSAGTG